MEAWRKLIFPRLISLRSDRKPLSKQIKILDADAVFLKTHLPSAMAPEGRGCQADADCDFFDCKNVFVCRNSRCVDAVMLSEEKRARSLVTTLCEKVILPVSEVYGWRYYAMKAQGLLFGGSPKRLLTDLDQVAVKTLLPACDIHRSAPDKSEL
jgi:hypothetical protein